jgi:hypothetical protein
MPVKALLIASLVVAAFFCGPLTLATNAKSKTFHNGCNRGAGALTNPKKCASSLDEDQYPDQRNPMKWTGATKRPSLSTNFETNSSGRNTVCGRVVVMKKKSNIFSCIEIVGKKNKKIHNPRRLSETNKLSKKKAIPAAVEGHGSCKTTNSLFKMTHEVGALTMENKIDTCLGTDRPAKNAPTLSLPNLMVELNPLEPMQWTGATKPQSFDANFKTNSSGRNTVCGRVVVMKAKNNVFTSIGAKKIKKLGNIANPCAATKKALNEMTTTAVQAQNGITPINLLVKSINEVSTVTGTIETVALAVKSTPRPDDYYDLKKKKEAAGRTKKKGGGMEVKISSANRKSCVLTSIFRSWVESFENLQRFSRASPSKYQYFSCFQL